MSGNKIPTLFILIGKLIIIVKTNREVFKLLDFFLDHLLIIIIACIVLFLILPFLFNSIKTILTVIIIILILGTLGVFGPKFFENIKEPISATKEFTESTIKPVIEKELSGSEFNYDANTKNYVIKSNSFKIEGVADSNEADVVFKDKKYTIDVSFLKTFIQDQINKQTQTN